MPHEVFLKHKFSLQTEVACTFNHFIARYTDLIEKCKLSLCVTAKCVRVLKICHEQKRKLKRENQIKIRCKIKSLIETSDYHCKLAAIYYFK